LNRRRGGEGRRSFFSLVTSYLVLLPPLLFRSVSSLFLSLPPIPPSSSLLAFRPSFFCLSSPSSLSSVNCSSVSRSLLVSLANERGWKKRERGSNKSSCDARMREDERKGGERGMLHAGAMLRGREEKRREEKEERRKRTRVESKEEKEKERNNLPPPLLYASLAKSITLPYSNSSLNT
jgi:hypothetical protein